MPYKELPGKSNVEYRLLFDEIYCQAPIKTFDGIEVQFYSNMFNHAFYESADNKRKDKSLFSYNRAEKILWIKETLEDPKAVLKKGWIRETKSYSNSRRVAIVKDNYVVVIHIFKARRARFVTAYEANNSINKILSSPDWILKKKTLINWFSVKTFLNSKPSGKEH